MTGYEYQNFDLHIDHGPDGDYRARVLYSPGGQSAGSVRFRPPFTRDEVARLAGRVHGRSRDADRLHRPTADEVTPTILDLGRELFTAVFADDVGGCLNRSLPVISRGDGPVRHGLRIRLHLGDCPELADLPWEILYDPFRRRHLCMSDSTPLVRYLPLAEAERPVRVDGPLRVLAVIASPASGPGWLDTDAEWGKLCRAMAGPIATAAITVDRLAPPTFSELHKQLGQAEYHVLHFIGHGRFNRARNEGELFFSDVNEVEQPVSATDLGVVLHDHRSLRLVVLNACEGGRSDGVDLFAGTAQTLTQQSVPAVVAMQFVITDSAAIAFSEGFYESIAAGQPLDAATATGRTRILTIPNHTEWATPVLYTRAADTTVFTVESAEAAQRAVSANVAGRRPAVVAWGSHDLGQCDVPPDLTDAVAVAAGDFHCLALTRSGQVVGWGLSSAPPPAWLTGVTAIAAGGRHNLALMAGEVVAWGSDAAGQCSVPPRLSTCTAIAAGGAHSAAITTAGTVVAWGSDSYGQATVPVGLTGVQAVATGGQHSLALTRSGDVVVWGRGSPLPPGTGRVVAIAAGHSHSVALVEDGTIVSWSNADDATFTPVSTPVVAVTAGLHFTVALTADGRAEAFSVPTPGRSVPMPAPDGPPVVQIAAGIEHIVALLRP